MRSFPRLYSTDNNGIPCRRFFFVRIVGWEDKSFRISRWRTCYSIFVSFFVQLFWCSLPYEWTYERITEVRIYGEQQNGEEQKKKTTEMKYPRRIVTITMKQRRKIAEACCSQILRIYLLGILFSFRCSSSVVKLTSQKWINLVYTYFRRWKVSFLLPCREVHMNDKTKRLIQPTAAWICCKAKIRTIWTDG